VNVTIYAMGIITCSACAPATLTAGKVAAAVREQEPGAWRISSDPEFADGTPNPGPCDTGPGRRHWLLEC
jgi:hypothetical protein